jgi:hypothetical protein
VTLEELNVSIKTGVAPTSASKPVMALWHDARGDWEKAHECAQSDSSREAAWVHAYLHRKEGDSSNAAYWYSRAARTVSNVPLDQEWSSIAQELLATKR